MDEPRWVDASGTAHENCKIMFLVENDLLSEGDYDPGNAPEMAFRRTGVVYVCPHCGQAWGHVILLDSTGRQMPFEITAVACERHPSQWDVPGSLLSGHHNSGYLRLLSTRALRREFVVHHRHWRKS
jgi:predicted RNA-binding Zn-ribbon protein involved in translation (DUF1610 family)